MSRIKEVINRYMGGVCTDPSNTCAPLSRNSCAIARPRSYINSGSQVAPIEMPAEKTLARSPVRMPDGPSCRHRPEKLRRGMALMTPPHERSLKLPVSNAAFSVISSCAINALVLLVAKRHFSESIPASVYMVIECHFVGRRRARESLTYRRMNGY
jgi:hypothetical protein